MLAAQTPSSPTFARPSSPTPAAPPSVPPIRWSRRAETDRAADIFEKRSRVSQLTALFRVPFNVLVTLALVLGLEGYRKEFLIGSGMALLAAAGVAGVIAGRAGRVGAKQA